MRVEDTQVDPAHRPIAYINPNIRPNYKRELKTTQQRPPLLTGKDPQMSETQSHQTRLRPRNQPTNTVAERDNRFNDSYRSNPPSQQNEANSLWLPKQSNLRNKQRHLKDEHRTKRYPEPRNTDRNLCLPKLHEPPHTETISLPTEDMETIPQPREYPPTDKSQVKPTQPNHHPTAEHVSDHTALYETGKSMMYHQSRDTDTSNVKPTPSRAVMTNSTSTELKPPSKHEVHETRTTYLTPRDNFEETEVNSIEITKTRAKHTIRLKVRNPNYLLLPVREANTSSNLPDGFTPCNTINHHDPTMDGKPRPKKAPDKHPRSFDWPHLHKDHNHYVKHYRTADSPLLLPNIDISREDASNEEGGNCEDANPNEEDNLPNLWIEVPPPNH